MSQASAVAYANIALVKYWGKRDSALNLPAAGSLSLTLNTLRTDTMVHFDESLTHDSFELDGRESDPRKLTTWLDLVRARAKLQTRAHVVSRNAFPTASGLASSASAYAALAVAASSAAGLSLTVRELSELARRGSGSAARSIFAGFALMHAGTKADGSDAVAEPIVGADDWDLRMVIAVVGGGKVKGVSSRDAMEHCAATSPLYQAWLDCVPNDVQAARSAIDARDLAALGAITRDSAMAMHAAAMASRPPVRYWQAATLRCLDRVEELVGSGIPAYPTMDAGPHVKVLTDAAHCQEVARAIGEIPEVTEVKICAPGPAAHLLSEASD